MRFSVNKLQGNQYRDG